MYCEVKLKSIYDSLLLFESMYQMHEHIFQHKKEDKSYSWISQGLCPRNQDCQISEAPPPAQTPGPHRLLWVKVLASLAPWTGDEPGPLQNGLGTTHCWDTGHPFDAIIGLWEFFPFLMLASVQGVPCVFSMSIWDHSCWVPQLSELPSHRQSPTPASSFQICFPTCQQAQDIPFTEDKTLDLLLEFWLGNICCQSVKHSSRGYGGVSRFSLLWLTLRHSENLSTVRWPATPFPRGTRWQCVKSFY